MTSKTLRAGRRAALALALMCALAPAGDAAAVPLLPSERAAAVDAALRSTVPPELALALAQAGASGRRVPGARGAMGLRDELARREFGLFSWRPRDARAEAGLAIALLERLHRRHGGRWDLALSHFRAGPLSGAEDDAVAHPHTVGYVADVLERWRRNQDDESVTVLIRAARQGLECRSRYAVGRDGAWRIAGDRFRSEDRPAIRGAGPARFF